MGRHDPLARQPRHRSDDSPLTSLKRRLEPAPSTGDDCREADPRGTRERRGVEAPLTLRYATTLAEARSCLAALADASVFERSIAYEHLLLELDAMHDGPGPTAFPVADSLPEPHRRLEARLVDLSVRRRHLVDRAVPRPARRDRARGRARSFEVSHHRDDRLTESLTGALTGGGDGSQAVHSRPGRRLRKQTRSHPDGSERPVRRRSLAGSQPSELTSRSDL